MADGAVLKLESRSQSSVVSGQLGKTTDHGPRTTDVVRLTLEGANPSATMTGLDELPGKSNYFLGNDPAKWLREIPNYRRAEAAEVYPGIGLVYYGTPSRPGQLEYDFTVAPGADPRAIRLQIETGNSKIAIDSNGDLVVKVAGKE